MAKNHLRITLGSILRSKGILLTPEANLVPLHPPKPVKPVHVEKPKVHEPTTNDKMMETLHAAEVAKDKVLIGNIFKEANQMGMRGRTLQTACGDALGRILRGEAPPEFKATCNPVVALNPAASARAEIKRQERQDRVGLLKMQADQKMALVREYCSVTKSTLTPSLANLSSAELRQKIKDARRAKKSIHSSPNKKDGKKKKDNKQKRSQFIQSMSVQG